MSFRDLRALGVDEQVALLFVILFGLLILVTLGTFLYSLRDSTESRSAAALRFRGDLRAVWIGTVLFWLA